MSKNFWIGLVLIIIGIVGSQQDINNNYHYYGTGILTGIGLCLLVQTLIAKRKN